MLPASFAARARTVLLCALAASIPWPFMYSAWALVALTVFSVFTADWRAILRAFSENKVLCASVLFFLLYAASYFWSENKDTASWAISSKLALLLLPIVLGAGAAVDDRSMRWILRATVAGVLCVALYCLVNAYTGWRNTGDTSLFFYHNLVTAHDGQKLALEANAVYMALYAYIALGALVGGLITGKNLWMRVVLYGVALPVIAVFFILLSARTLLVLFAVLPMPLLLWHRLRHQRRGMRAIWVAGLVVLVCAVGIISTDNPIKRRFADVSNPDISEAFLSNYRDRQDWRFNNLTTRIFLWRVGLETAKQNQLWWLGAGAGDVHHLTDARMNALGIEGIYDAEHPSHLRSVNMHNMLLQALLAVGVLGVLLLGIMLAAPIICRMPGTEGIFWWMLAITFTLFMMQEAVLQTQAGIMPFALFSNLFWNRYRQVKMLQMGTGVKPV